MTSIFPLPPVGRLRPWKAGGTSRTQVVIQFANLMVAALNILYGADFAERPVYFPPSAAQRRVSGWQLTLAQRFVDGAVAAASDALYKFLHHSLRIAWFRHWNHSTNELGCQRVLMSLTRTQRLPW